MAASRQKERAALSKADRSRCLAFAAARAAWRWRLLDKEEYAEGDFGGMPRWGGRVQESGPRSIEGPPQLVGG